MKPRIHVLTLGVADLERSLKFYRALGLESPGIIGTEWPGDDKNPAGDVAMFQLDNDLVLAVYPDLAKDANIAPPAGSGAFSIGHIVPSKSEVDRILTDAAAAGATITDQPHDRAWGIYSGYFADPDGHLWEVIYNPQS